MHAPRVMDEQTRPPPRADDDARTSELTRYDAMCRAIDAAYEVDEVKDIRDKAAALEHYARQAHNTEAEVQCCEIRLRAERKWGQIYAASEKAKGGGKRGADGKFHQASPVTTPGDEERTLADMAVSRDQSSRWQKLGEVPEEQLGNRRRPTPSSSRRFRRNRIRRRYPTRRYGCAVDYATSKTSTSRWTQRKSCRQLDRRSALLTPWWLTWRPRTFFMCSAIAR